MGAISNRLNNIFNKFLGRILGFDSGGFELSHGTHEIIVPIDFLPRNVWTNVIAHGNEGCGQFPVNKVGCLISENKIIFIAEIETETAHIEWFAVK